MGETQFTDVQRKLIEEAAVSSESSKTDQGVAQAISKETLLRRAVYDAIVQLSDIVSENALKMLLPFLHCSAWDEVIEERFLGNPRLCGFPVCGEVVEAPSRKQRYHIDRAARKIYEHRVETDMYCSRFCLLRSASVRSQLPDEPLWLSGNISKRICSTFQIDGPPELGNGNKKGEIEIVRIVEEKLSDLKIREAESSSQSETEDDANEADVEDFLEGISSILEDEELNGKKQKARNEISAKISSHERTRKTSKNSSTVATPVGKAATKDHPVILNPRLPDPQMSDKHSFTHAELEKLSKLRAKYSNLKAKKPIVVDPAPMTPSPSKAERPSKHVSVSVKRTPERTLDKTDEEPKLVRHVRALFRGWITGRTRQLLRSGGLCVSDAMNSVMRQFFRPFSDDVIEMNECVLPNVDSVDVRKKRLHIFLESVKKPLYAFQQDLEFSFSDFNWLYVLAATFNLEATTITNFPNDVLILVCVLLLKLISLLDTSVEDSVFPRGKVSDKLVHVLANIDVDMAAFDSIISEILKNEENPI